MTPTDKRKQWVLRRNKRFSIKQRKLQNERGRKQCPNWAEHNLHESYYDRRLFGSK